MSSFLVVDPLKFGPNPAAPKENTLVTAMAVPASVELADEALIHGLLESVQRIPADLSAKLTVVNLKKEERAAKTQLELKGQAVLAADAVSFHSFTNEEGEIVRRVVVLYPMSRFRQGELSKPQVLAPLIKAAEADLIELVDLRSFESEQKFLEGLGAVVFSPDGKYVYVARSPCANLEVLDVLCSEENLNIPEENRFIFSAKLNDAPVLHTNVLGWCGTGICAWAKSVMQFDSDEDKEKFDSHLSETYETVLELSEDELRHYAGCAFEGFGRTASGEERRIFYASATVREKGNISETTREKIVEHYGADNIAYFYADMIERRCGSSVGSVVARTIVHGDAVPNAEQQATLAVAGL